MPRRARTALLLASLTLALLSPGASGAGPATGGGEGAAGALLRTLRWRLVGPFRGGWGEMVEGVASRPDTFYFGAAGGGVWRSDNAGRTWRSLFDDGPTAPVGAIAVAPSDPDTLYIGAGQRSLATMWPGGPACSARATEAEPGLPLAWRRPDT